MNKKVLMLVCGLLMLNLISCIHIPPTIENDPSLEFIQINGYKFHVKTFGEKSNPPILIVHGGPGGDSNYLYPLKELSKNYYVIFYDQRGTGLSPRVPKEDLTLESSMNDLIQIIEHYRSNGKIRLIGHSWGAMLVIGYLGRHGDRVSHAVVVEPGILNTSSAIEFVSQIKKNQSISDILYLVGSILKTPFVAVLDGHERFDYVMTKILNRNRPGGIYQCKNDSMPDNSFVRAGYDSFSNMLKPVMDDPKKFVTDLTLGISNYKGQLLMISSECSFIGYSYQERLHIPFMPPSTVHLKAVSMGHNMLTLNSAWSVGIINDFFIK
jgi:proline iminopeptidase